MKTFTVEVTQTVTVTLDETKFDEVFMQEFRDSFFNFDTIDEHAEHLAQLEARGITDEFGQNFIEGYGPAAEMGIKMAVVGVDMDIVETSA